MAPPKRKSALSTDIESDPDDEILLSRSAKPRKRVPSVTLTDPEPVEVTETIETHSIPEPTKPDDEEERPKKRPRLKAPRPKSDLSNASFSEDSMFDLGGSAPALPAPVRRRTSRLSKAKSSLSESSATSSPKITSPGSRNSKRSTSFVEVSESPTTMVLSDDEVEITASTIKSPPPPSRNRTPSITPPPEPPRHYRDPELAALKRQFTASASSFHIEGLSDDDPIDDLLSPEPTTAAGSSTPPDPQPTAAVIIKVNFRTWPPAEEGQVRKPAKMKLNSTDPFSKIIRHAALAILKTEESDIVLTYNDAKLFGFGTPLSVRMHKVAEIDCWTQAHYKAYGVHQEEEKRKEAEALRTPKVPTEPVPVEEEDVPLEVIPMVGIKLQEDTGTVYKVKVATTTTIEKLTSIYVDKLRTTPLPAGASVRFVMDGEVLDNGSQLCDLDIDNGDILEVRV